MPLHPKDIDGIRWLHMPDNLLDRTEGEMRCFEEWRNMKEYQGDRDSSRSKAERHVPTRGPGRQDPHFYLEGTPTT